MTAIASMYLFGWISVRHVLRWWAGKQRRSSGGTLASTFALLTVTGFALFFVTSDAWQRYTSGAHDVLGIGALVLRQEIASEGLALGAKVGARLSRRGG